MDIAIFPPNELPIALATVRAVDPEPSPAQDRFIAAVARLHRTSIEPSALPKLTAADSARAILDPHRRKRMLQLAMVMSTIDGDVAKPTAERVADLAYALGVDERGLRTLHQIAANHDRIARFDFIRRMAGRLIGGAWRDEGWAGAKKFIDAMRGAEDPALARRYNRLGLLPAGTFGRALWEHWVSRDFAFPGQKYSIPEAGMFHDLGHVLSGYDTDPDGELQQAAFQAGFVRNDGFVFIFFAISQFHLGLKITPVADAEIGKLDVDKLMVALGRGAACKVDISDHWDFWPHMPRPLEEVRAELEIPPLAA